MSDTSTPTEQPDFVWRARVTAASRGRASAKVRTQAFGVGAPLDFDEEAPELSALEYLLGALGADVLNGFRSDARRRRLQIDEAEAAVEGRLDNPLTHLGVIGERGHPGLREARVKVYVSSPDSEDALRKSWSSSLERSPLVRTLRPCVDLILELELLA